MMVSYSLFSSLRTSVGPRPNSRLHLQPTGHCRYCNEPWELFNKFSFQDPHLDRMANDSFSPTTLFLALLFSIFVAAVVYGQAIFAHWYQERVYGPRIYNDEETSTVRFNHDTDIYEEDNGIPLVELTQRPVPLNLRWVHFETPLQPISIPPSSSSYGAQHPRFPPSAYVL
jgi:hypothetical protein